VEKEQQAPLIVATIFCLHRPKEVHALVGIFCRAGM
jgi:hypothetical protein